MNPAAQSLLSSILALLPTLYLQASLKALLFLLLRGHGKARPQHAGTKSPSALSRFLNRYPWPTRALIRLARKEAQEALDRARRRRGPKPRLLVVLDLVTLEKRGRFPHLPLSFFTVNGAFLTFPSWLRQGKLKPCSAYLLLPRIWFLSLSR